MVGEIGCQRLELGILVGDVAAASRAQVELAVIRVDQHPVAVPLTLERPLRRFQLLDRALGRQHRREIARLGTLLLLHPVREPVLAVGLNQRVPAVDLLAVQRDDDLAPFFGPVGGIVPELLGLVCACVPHDHLARAVLPPRDRGFEGQVLERMILGVHGQMVDGRGVRQVLRHRPADQHAVAFQSEVVMQSPGVVLLNDEQVVIARLWRFFWHWFRCFRRVAHAAVLRQAILCRNLLVQVGQ